MMHSPKNFKKFKLNVGKIPIPTPKPFTSHINLNRSTKVVLNNGDEYTVAYDELKTQQLLGRGAFGTVTQKYHPPSNYSFAVKMMDDKLYDNSEKNQMDLKIGQIIGSSCPFLVNFYGALHAETYIWILTEIMDTSLDRFYMKSFALKDPLTELFLSKVSFSVVSGLSFMRNLSLVHRDIKPSNILLNYTGECKLCDFGISATTKDSLAYSFIGSQTYMPPEKIKGEDKGYTIKADLWSLGISLIEMATGHSPFKNLDFMSLVNRVTEKDSPSLDPAKFSSEICSFVNKCLIKDPLNRASCDDLLGDEFILKYQNQPHDLVYVKKVIDEIKKDKIQ